MKPVSVLQALLPVLALVLSACQSKFEGGGDLRAQKDVVVDPRSRVRRLERDPPVYPRRALNLAQFSLLRK